MNAGEKLAIERAIVELADVDEALTLTTAAIRKRVTAAMRVLVEARDEQNDGAPEAEVQS